MAGDYIEALDLQRAHPRQKRSRATIDGILDAAEQLIASHGQISYIVNELAETADTSVGRIYYWFDDLAAVTAGVAQRTISHLGTVEDLDGLIDLVDTRPALPVLALVPHPLRTRLRAALGEIVDPELVPAYAGLLLDWQTLDDTERAERRRLVGRLGVLSV